MTVCFTVLYHYDGFFTGRGTVSLCRCCCGRSTVFLLLYCITMFFCFVFTGRSTVSLMTFFFFFFFFYWQEYCITMTGYFTGRGTVSL